MSNNSPAPQDSPPLPPMLKYLVFIRVGFLLLVLGGIYWLANSAGLLDQASPEGIRQLVSQWGMFSVVIYLVAFSVGQLVYVPGMFFVVAGSLIFGGVNGFFLSMLGALMSVSLSFFVARLLGGTPLANPERTWVKRLVWRLETRPVSSMFMLRLMLSTAPWLNYLLGMSSVRYRDYLLAAFLGMFPAILLTVVFTDWLLQFLS
jgi:uncharacterized membrane protein YdjX (TVP38/TMEM64 family)